jgi:hypothetical protein
VFDFETMMEGINDQHPQEKGNRLAMSSIESSSKFRKGGSLFKVVPVELHRRSKPGPSKDKVVDVNGHLRILPSRERETTLDRG